MRREAIKRKISATVSTAAAVHILIIFSFEFLRIYFPTFLSCYFLHKREPDSMQNITLD